ERRMEVVAAVFQPRQPHVDVTDRIGEVDVREPDPGLAAVDAVDHDHHAPRRLADDADVALELERALALPGADVLAGRDATAHADEELAIDRAAGGRQRPTFGALQEDVGRRDGLAGAAGALHARLGDDVLVGPIRGHLHRIGEGPGAIVGGDRAQVHADRDRCGQLGRWSLRSDRSAHGEREQRGPCETTPRAGNSGEHRSLYSAARGRLLARQWSRRALLLLFEALVPGPEELAKGLHEIAPGEV